MAVRNMCWCRQSDGRQPYRLLYYVQSPARGCAGVVSAVSKAAVSGRRSRINMTQRHRYWLAPLPWTSTTRIIAAMAGGTDSIAAQRRTMGVTSGNSMA